MTSVVRHSLKQILIAIFIGGLLVPASRAATSKIWLFADTNAFQALQPELNQWKADVNAEGRYEAEIYALPPMSPELLRLILQLGRQNSNLAGALLVGKMPVVTTEATKNLLLARAPYPTDVYYTDLDCEWFDVNDNGWKDMFGATGGLQPDIWLGRIDCEMLTFPGKSRIDLLRDYFRKDHAYRTGKLSLPGTAQMFLAFNGDFPSNGLGNLYSPFQLFPIGTVNGSLYLQQISPLPGCEFVYLDAHSTETEHLLFPTVVHSPDIRAANPKGLFFFLDTCRASCFTSNNYIAGNYLFGSTYGLLVAGATADTDGYAPTFAMQSLSAAAGQDWGSILLQFSRDQNTWSPEFAILGDPTLVPHFNSPAFEIHKPFAFSATTPLKIVRPAGAALQLWRIPVKAQLTAGAGDRLSLAAKNLPAGATAVSNSLFIAGMGTECDAEALVAVSPTATLGKREITLEAVDARGKLATTTCWIEIVNAPTVKPDFSIAPDHPLDIPKWYYGQRAKPIQVDLTVKLIGASQAIPAMLNLQAINWPAGFEIAPQKYDLHWSSGALLSQAGTAVSLPFRIAVSPTNPVGLYNLPVKASCLGTEKTFIISVRILPPYPEIQMDPAAPQMLPGDKGYINFSTTLDGYGHLAYTTSSIPGIEVWRSVFSPPWGFADDQSISIATDWSLPPGHYSLIQGQWLDHPAVPAKSLLSVDVLPQYSLSLVPVVSNALGGVLELTIRNQALDNPAYKLNLSVECPTQVLATLSSPQILVPTANGGTVHVSIPFTTAINITSLLGRSFPFTITVKAKSPDYPWPAQSVSVSFEVPQIPYIPQQYSLIPILFIPTPGPSPVYLSNLYRTTQVLTPVTTQISGTLGR